MLPRNQGPLPDPNHLRRAAMRLDGERIRSRELLLPATLALAPRVCGDSFGCPPRPGSVADGAGEHERQDDDAGMASQRGPRRG